MTTYTVTPHHHSLIDGEIETTSYREARRIARAFRDNYHQGVTIEEDGIPTDWWKRDESGKWHRVNVWEKS